MRKKALDEKMTDPIPMRTLRLTGLAYDDLRNHDVDRNSIDENTFRKTRVGNSEPAHNACFRESSARNGLAIAPAYYGNEPERPERQIFRA